MKKIFSLFIISLIFMSGLTALEVNEPELRVTGSETIEFINYVGPHKVIDSLEAIKRIGSDMGKIFSKVIGKENISLFFFVLHVNREGLNLPLYVILIYRRKVK